MSSRLHKWETKDLAKAARNITLGQLSKPVVVCRDFSEVDSQPHRRLLQRRQLRPGHRRAPTRAATRTTLVLVDALLAVRRFQRERERAGENTPRHAFPPSFSAVFVHLFGRVRLRVPDIGAWVPLHDGPVVCLFVAQNWQLRRAPVCSAKRQWSRCRNKASQLVARWRFLRPMLKVGRVNLRQNGFGQMCCLRVRRISLGNGSLWFQSRFSFSGCSFLGIVQFVWLLLIEEISLDKIADSS